MKWDERMVDCIVDRTMVLDELTDFLTFTQIILIFIISELIFINIVIATTGLPK